MRNVSHAATGATLHQARGDEPVQGADHSPDQSGGDFVVIVQPSGQRRTSVPAAQGQLAGHERAVRAEHDLVVNRTPNRPADDMRRRRMRS